MKTALTIALRDLRHGHRGFWVFFSCLALGVAAITIVSVISLSVLSGIARDGKIILGGELAISKRFNDLTENELALVDESSKAVSKFIELRTLMRTKKLQDSLLVALKAVDDVYPLVGEFEIHGGEKLASALAVQNNLPGAVVDAAIVDSGKVAVGDLVSLGNSQFQIRGMIKIEPDRIGSTEQMYGFWPRVLISMNALEQTGLIAFGSLSFYEYRLLLQEGVNLADLTLEFNEKHPMLEVRDFSNSSPNLSEVIQRLGVLLSLAGLTTLLIGGVGASNAVRAYMNTRLPTIAILKCVGASSNFVLKTFLIQITVLSAIGVVLGVVFGLAATFLSAAALETLLLVPLAITVTPTAAVIVILYGMLTAFLFTLWPLACALETHPAALFRNSITNESQSASWIYIAISVGIAVLLAALVIWSAYEQLFAIWFVFGVTCAWIVFRLISLAIIRLSKTIHKVKSPAARLAIANLHRPGAATSDIVLAVGIGLSVLVATVMVSTNIDQQMETFIPEQAPSFFFIGIQSEQLDEFENLIESDQNAQEFDILPYIPGRIVKIKGMNPEDALVDKEGEWIIDENGERTLSYTAKPLAKAELLSGEWWPEDYAGPPLLSIHSTVANSFDLGLGDTMTLNVLGRDITAKVHNVRHLEWESMQLNFAIMLSPEPLRSIPHSSVGTLRMNEAGEFAFQEVVASQFPNVTILRIKEALNRVSELVQQGRNAAQGINAVTIIAGILVLTGIVISENRRRAYESVLLKTIGASRRYILATFSFEYLIQGGVAAFVAVIVGSIASWAIVNSLMGWSWSFDLAAAVYTVVLGLTISCLLGLAGIWRALKQRPLQYLRNE